MCLQPDQQQQQQQVGPALQQQPPIQYDIPSFALPTTARDQRFLRNVTGPNYFVGQGRQGLGMLSQLSVPAEMEGVEQGGTTGREEIGS